MGERNRHGWYPGKSAGRYLPHWTKARKYMGLDRRVRLFTPREVAVILRHSVPWVRKQIREGRMKAVTFQNRYYINSLELQRWLGNVPRAKAPFSPGGNYGKAKKKT